MLDNDFSGRQQRENRWRLRGVLLLLTIFFFGTVTAADKKFFPTRVFYQDNPKLDSFVNKTESLPPDRVKNLGDKIQRLGYWTLPVRDAKEPGRDGAQWVIEGIDYGRYRLVDRWSPRNGALRELGLYFLRDLSRLHLKSEETY